MIDDEKYSRWLYIDDLMKTINKKSYSGRSFAETLKKQDKTLILTIQNKAQKDAFGVQVPGGFLLMSVLPL